MKKILLLTLSILSLNGAFAQGFTFNQTKASASGSSGEFELVTYSWVKNIDQGADTVFWWVRENNNLPSNWQNAICDINTCWGSSVDSSSFVLKFGDSGNVDVHFYPFETGGAGTSDIYVYRNGDRENGMALTFTANGWTLSKAKAPKSEIQIYPNPAKNEFTLKAPVKAGTEIQIINVLGQVVHSVKETGAETKINISALPDGVYMIRFTDNQGKTQMKKIKKANS